MTDISKEAVERAIDDLDGRNSEYIQDTLRALSARVAELEYIRDAKDEEIETLRSGLETAEDIRTDAYKRGLDGAKQKVLDLWAGRTCAEVAEAIEALKQEVGT